MGGNYRPSTQEPRLTQPQKEDHRRDLRIYGKTKRALVFNHQAASLWQSSHGALFVTQLQSASPALFVRPTNSGSMHSRAASSSTIAMIAAERCASPHQSTRWLHTWQPCPSPKRRCTHHHPRRPPMGGTAAEELSARANRPPPKEAADGGDINRAFARSRPGSRPITDRLAGRDQEIPNPK